MQGLCAEVPLGSPRIPTNTVDMELFELLRLPVLHGGLPEAGSPLLGVLGRCPGVTADVARLLCTIDPRAPPAWAGGLPPGDLDALVAHAMAHDDGNSETVSVGHYHISRRGLTELTRALAPGELGVLMGGNHFSTVFRFPKPTPAGKRSYLYRLVHEQDQPSGVAWERLVVRVASPGAAPKVGALYCDQAFEEVQLTMEGDDVQLTVMLIIKGRKFSLTGTLAAIQQTAYRQFGIRLTLAQDGTSESPTLPASAPPPSPPNESGTGAPFSLAEEGSGGGGGGGGGGGAPSESATDAPLGEGGGGGGGGAPVAEEVEKAKEE